MLDFSPKIGARSGSLTLVRGAYQVTVMVSGKKYNRLYVDVQCDCGNRYALLLGRWGVRQQCPGCSQRLKAQVCRSGQIIEPGVYAILYPAPIQVLKIGFVSPAQDGSHRWVSNKNRPQFDIEGPGRLIWNRPGDLWLEAYMQVRAAMSYEPLFASEVRSRISEWFAAGSVGDATLVSQLSEWWSEYQTLLRMRQDQTA